jgi:hypothetical protein
MARRPESRIEVPRSSENMKRNLCAVPPTFHERQMLAGRVRYGGYSKHKLNPHLWGLTAYGGNAPDRTFCEDAGFHLPDQSRIPALLKRGIDAGLFGDLVSRGDPTMLWTIDDNGWIYELRLTTPSQALYHGYPVRPSNAFSLKVISRFEEWLNKLPHQQRNAKANSVMALRQARTIYR